MLLNTRNLLSSRSCIEIAKRFGNAKERMAKGLHPNPNAQGPLTDLPDWSYVDGRGFGNPSLGQKRRYLRDVELAKTVVKNVKMFKTAKELVSDKTLPEKT